MEPRTAARLGSALPAIVAALFLAFGVAVQGDRLGHVLVVVALVLFTSAIALAASRPWVSMALLVIVPVIQLVQPRQAPDVLGWTLYGAVLLVAPFTGSSLDGLRRYAVLLIGALVCALDSVVIVRDGGWGRWTLPNGQPFQTHPLWWEFVTVFLGGFGLTAGAWAVGVVLSSLRLRRRLEATEERLEDQVFALRLSEDRARIARDVHDALAHSLAVVVSQAEGAAALLELRPQTTKESLGNIASVGRSALIDVRRLVEQIREDDDVAAVPSSIADLETLVEQMRQVGMRITSTSTGAPAALAASQGIAVYQITREALTNALKHAGTTSTASVALDWSVDALVLRVSSHGVDPLIDPRSAGRGIGIEGMKERARIAGGWLTAEAGSGGEFVVTARFPSDGMVAHRAPVTENAGERS
jgi:signal transduction histidine kinase